MTEQEDDYRPIQALHDRYPLGTTAPDNADGRKWKRREEESEAYFKRYSVGWEQNRDLLVKFDRMITAFGSYVAIAYPIISNFVSDMYFRNPDPFIQDKSGNKDIGRMLTNVVRSVHMECDTEREMRDAFFDQGWAGFGVVAGSFRQRPDNAGDLVLEPTGENDETGNPAMRPATAPTGEMDEMMQPVMAPTGEIVEPYDQKVIIQRISPWKNRFDPHGRRWDMSDHLYWGYESSPYLGALMDDPSLDFDDKARLMSYFGTNGSAFMVDGGEDEITSTGRRETDPRFIRVRLRSFWSRPDHMIYRKPVGANFTFKPIPWDEEWERADMFPMHYIPRNRIPEDQKNTEGFIGLPDLTLIRPHIENINKLQGLIVGALEKVIDVYVTIKGAMTSQETNTFEDGGRRFKIVGIDPEAFKKFPSAMAGDKDVLPKDILYLLPTGDTKDMQHMAKIDHEFSLISQIMGQGPAERGGVSQSDTATESLGVQQGLSRRMSSNRNDAGKHYNAVTKMIFLILQARQTLPIRYQMTTAYNDAEWKEFANPQGVLKNVDLHFDYATGSTEPQTREQQFALRERAATILMPVLQASQDTRNMMKLCQELIEPLGLLDMDGFFDDAASQMVMQLLQIMLALGSGKVSAADPKVSTQIMELISQIAEKILTPAQMQQVAAEAAGQSAAPHGVQNTGSIAKAPSPAAAAGEAAARGSAGAGASGAVAYSQELPSPALQNTPT